MSDVIPLTILSHPLLSAETLFVEWTLQKCAALRGISPTNLRNRLEIPGVWRDHFYKVGTDWRTTPNLQIALDFELARLTKVALSQ